MSSVRTISPWISEEDFLSGPETMQQVELLDGEVIVFPSPILLINSWFFGCCGSLKWWWAVTYESRPNVCRV